MIELKITIPAEEIGDGKAALEKRMAVLGYAWGHATVPVIGGNATLRYAPESELPQAAQDAKVYTEEVKYAEAAKPEPEPASPSGPRWHRNPRRETRA